MLGDNNVLSVTGELFNNLINLEEKSSLHRGAGLSLKDRVKR